MFTIHNNFNIHFNSLSFAFNNLSLFFIIFFGNSDSIGFEVYFFVALKMERDLQICPKKKEV